MSKNLLGYNLPVRPPLCKNLFGLKLETGSYFLKSRKKKLSTLRQIRYVNIQDPLWRHMIYVRGSVKRRLRTDCRLLFLG